MQNFLSLILRRQSFWYLEVDMFHDNPDQQFSILQKQLSQQCQANSGKYYFLGMFLHLLSREKFG